MAKQINVSIGGVKKTSKVFACIGGVVKTVKKGLTGVGGAVKEFFSSELILYDYGATSYSWGNVYSFDNDYIGTGNSSTASTGIYLTTAVDLSSYTTCHITFRTSFYAVGDNAAYRTGRIQVINKNDTSQVATYSYTRTVVNGIVTYSFNITSNGLNTNNVIPRFVFSIYYNSKYTWSYEPKDVYKIWFT